MSSVETLKKIRIILQLIYFREAAGDIFRDLKNLMDVYGKNEIIVRKRKKYRDKVVINQKDSIFITYADTIYKKGEKPLQTLLHFMKRHIHDVVTGVHVLPFFPSSSDGGFAVINYKEVDPRYGTWEDVRKISHTYRLMIDLVLNHVSSKSKWFQRFLQGDKRYQDYFIWNYKNVEMPEVYRPRESPLFTKFNTADGEKFVWTTFSPDQIDLNYRNPEVLLKIIDVFLFYISQGVEIIRMDAVGYMWKEPHTSCVNLSKTHQIVKLLRTILEYVAPYALILTEANFPYKENISYFGEGHEANMVYQFALPPLVLDAFARKDTSHIYRITEKSRDDLLFFDFLASHDGIGLAGAKGILNQKEINNLIRLTQSHGGLISYEIKNKVKQPYELNISYFDAINDPNTKDDPYAVKRFIASQAVMLALKGIPGIYIQSLLGSRSYYRGVKETGIKRMINREIISWENLDKSLHDKESLRYEVLNKFLHLLKVRKKILAFHPYSERKLLKLDKRILAIWREFDGETVLALVNVSDDKIHIPDYQGKLEIIRNELFSGIVEPYGVYFMTF